ncbi:Host cell factor 1 [Trichinella zimbabwensis]|uniref:Host cell factor 1 n=1 Tax=Trichinella zimbabwensis TaxID=268475 RepID=A0A0V1HEH0_9BILA|nr:Host cell factor 1 [Trichinella zimbabwensis]
MNAVKVGDTKNIRCIKEVRWKKILNILGPIPRARHGHRAIALDDMIVIFGGGNDGIVDDLYVYFPEKNEWFKPTCCGDIPPGCAAFGMTTDKQKIFLYGGMVEMGHYSSDFYELNISTWEWRRILPCLSVNCPPPPPRLGHSFTFVKNLIYLFGGLTNGSVDNRHSIPVYLNDFYAIDLQSTPYQWFTPVTYGIKPSPRESHSACYYESDDKSLLIIYGGMNGCRLGDLWILDLKSMTWNSPMLSGIPPAPRSLHSASVIDDKMYIFGGWIPLSNKVTSPNQFEKEWKCTNTLGCFCITSLKWLEVKLGNIEDENPRPRAGHSAVAMRSRMYVWSGRDGYRKAWNAQICCKDMWCLETEKPDPPSNIQLVRASSTSLEICWKPVYNVDHYKVQIQRQQINEKRNELKMERQNLNQLPKVKSARSVDNVKQQPLTNLSNVLKIHAPPASGALRTGSSVVNTVGGSVSTPADSSTARSPRIKAAPVDTPVVKLSTTAVSSSPSIKSISLPQNLKAPTVDNGNRPAVTAPPNMIKSTVISPTINLQKDGNGLKIKVANISFKSEIERNYSPGLRLSAVSVKGGESNAVSTSSFKPTSGALPVRLLSNPYSSNLGNNSTCIQVSGNSGVRPPMKVGSAAADAFAKAKISFSTTSKLSSVNELSKAKKVVDKKKVESRYVKVPERIEIKPNPWYDVGVTKFNVMTIEEYDTPISANMTHAIMKAEDSEFRKVKLEEGAAYRFRICSVNDLGESDWVESAMFKTKDDALPSPPANIRVEKMTDCIQLSWQPPVNSRTEIVEYSVYLAMKSHQQQVSDFLSFMRVYCGFDAFCQVPNNIVDASLLNFQDQSAVIFRVAARNTAGYGPFTQIRWVRDKKETTESQASNISTKRAALDLQPPSAKAAKYDMQTC